MKFSLLTCALALCVTVVFAGSESKAWTETGPYQDEFWIIGVFNDGMQGGYNIHESKYGDSKFTPLLALAAWDENKVQNIQLDGGYGKPLRNFAQYWDLVGKVPSGNRNDYHNRKKRSANPNPVALPHPRLRSGYNGFNSGYQGYNRDYSGYRGGIGGYTASARNNGQYFGRNTGGLLRNNGAFWGLNGGLTRNNANLFRNNGGYVRNSGGFVTNFSGVGGIREPFTGSSGSLGRDTRNLNGQNGVALPNIGDHRRNNQNFGRNSGRIMNNNRGVAGNSGGLGTNSGRLVENGRGRVGSRSVLNLHSGNVMETSSGPVPVGGSANVQGTGEGLGGLHFDEFLDAENCVNCNVKVSQNLFFIRAISLGRV